MSYYKERMQKVVAVYKCRTANAVLVAYDDEEFWLPLSTLSAVTQNKVKEMVKGEAYTFWVAEWLCQEKGII